MQVHLWLLNVKYIPFPIISMASSRGNALDFIRYFCLIRTDLQIKHKHLTEVDQWNYSLL